MREFFSYGGGPVIAKMAFLPGNIMNPAKHHLPAHGTAGLITTSQMPAGFPGRP